MDEVRRDAQRIEIMKKALKAKRRYLVASARADAGADGATYESDEEAENADDDTWGGDDSRAAPAPPVSAPAPPPPRVPSSPPVAVSSSAAGAAARIPLVGASVSPGGRAPATAPASASSYVGLPRPATATATSASTAVRASSLLAVAAPAPAPAPAPAAAAAADNDGEGWSDDDDEHGGHERDDRDVASEDAQSLPDAVGGEEVREDEHGPLPTGWTQQTDAEGDVWYYCETDGRTSWTRPNADGSIPEV